MKYTILVCDDEPDTLIVTKKILEIGGYNVITLKDSLLIIDEMRRKAPDLLLIDLAMPGLTGDHVVSSIKQTEKLHKIPVVIFSASPDGKIKHFGLERTALSPNLMV
ncbi:MAG: response regulator [Sphingobacteriaceae bacterium]